jgi:RimJ/RimL family protein N-acetyltransferase
MMTPGITIRVHGRIRLRQMRENDIAHWLKANAGCSKEFAEAIYAEELAKPDGPGPDKQYVVETTSGEWVGFTGFGARPNGDAGGYFYIASPFRGQGYGREMVECVLQVMFRDCNAARCVIDYHDWNQSAARLYEKLGFIEDRRIRISEDKLSGEDRQMSPDKPVYAVVLVLTRERFLGGTPKPGNEEK